MPRSPRSDAAGVVRELHVERVVEPQLASQPRDRLRVGALADHLLHRIAGRDVQQQEDDDEHAGQRRNGEQQAAERESAATAPNATGRVSGPTIFTSVHRWPLKIVGTLKLRIQGCTAYRSL